MLVHLIDAGKGCFVSQILANLSGFLRYIRLDEGCARRDDVKNDIRPCLEPRCVIDPRIITFLIFLDNTGRSSGVWGGISLSLNNLAEMAFFVIWTL